MVKVVPRPRKKPELSLRDLEMELGLDSLEDPEQQQHPEDPEEEPPEEDEELDNPEAEEDSEEADAKELQANLKNVCFTGLLLEGSPETLSKNMRSMCLHLQRLRT
jgi:hypothetical protein